MTDSVHLVVLTSVWDELRQRLFTQDGRENAAVCLCGRADGGQGLSLLAHSLLRVPEHAYLARTHNHLEVAPDLFNRAVDLALARQWSLLVCHSHPGGGPARFSPSDVAGEDRLIPVLRNLVAVPHGTLLLTPDAWAGRIWAGPRPQALTRLAVRGPRVLVNDIHPAAPDPLAERQRLLWGEAGQARIANVRVGIVGVGGTGSCVAEQLCRLGARDFVLMDPDVVEDSNRSRMYGVSRQTRSGRPKVAVLANHLRRMAAQPLRVRQEAASVVLQVAADALADRDVVFGCTDNLLSRAVLNRFAHQYLVPLIDMGIRIDAREGRFQAAGGRVTLVGPGLACLRCSGHLDPDRLRAELLSPDERTALAAEGYVQGIVAPQPAVISLNSTVASLAVTAFLNLLHGLYPGHAEQVYDVAGGAVFVAQAPHRADCDICGPGGLTGAGDAVPVSTLTEVPVS